MRRAGDPRPNGFTLLELLVVLAILGLVLAATPALLKAGLPAFRVRAAAGDLAAALREARNAAVAEGKTIAVAIDPRALTYGGAGTLRALSATLHLEADAMPPGATAPAIITFRFYPDGSSSGGALRLVDGGSRAALRVDWLTGRIAVDD